MRLIKNSFLMIIVLVTISATGHSGNVDEPFPVVNVQTVQNFTQLAETAKKQRKLIMLEVSASYCIYCVKIEEEVLKPMLRSGDYDTNVLIRKVDIDGYVNLIDFAGQSISSATLARQYDIKVTPTLIFLNSQNQEVSKRIVGVNSLDYFGSYVDEAIEHGLTFIR